MIVLVALLALSGLLASCSTSGDQRAAPDGSTSTTAPAGRDRTGTPAAPSTGTEPSPEPPTVSWRSCDGGFECAELEVPVDHHQPDGGTLTLGLARRPADDADRRIGSLFVNPGGPGGSAIEFMEAVRWPSELTDRFDVVAFDPRGVGRSTPLDCRSHLQDIYTVDPTMEDAADEERYLSASQAFVDECEAKYGDLLPHLGTESVARDMDLARAAVGDDQITYLGYSYGTSIGQQYARLFPERVRAMVLDGVVDPSQTGLEAAAAQAAGFSTALDAFIAECDDDGCGLEEPAGRAIDDVISTSERRPIPAPGSDRPATPGVVALALGQALYAEQLWPVLARALRDADGGDGDGLVGLADDYLHRNADGSYPNGFEVYFAVSCIDSAWPKDPQVVFDTADRVGSEYPRVGEALVNDYVRCALWPVPPDPLDPVASSIEGLPPLVVISTTGDPATPYASGVRIAEQIPDARLVTNVGEGHTIFGQGKGCVDDPVIRYLVDLDAPDDGLRCR